MGCIIKKNKQGHIYYYYVESKRINGKPRIVFQKYLGTAEKLLQGSFKNADLSSAVSCVQDNILYTHSIDFGAESLLYDIGTRLGIVELIDSIAIKKDQGVSIGMYCLTEAINRAVSPVSTNGLQEWYSSTILPVISNSDPNAFTPQNFWNNTNKITEQQIEQIDELIVNKMLSEYDINTTEVIYDATNFFTFIDTLQETELAKRGHSKEKRNDLKIVGLALLVSPDYSIPLLHDTYPGNRPDTDEFFVMMTRLKQRLKDMTDESSKITVIFDRGNNSEKNIDLLESGEVKVHYVGGLKKNQLPELFDIPKRKFTPLTYPNLQNSIAYREVKKVYSRKLVTLTVYNPELERGQMQSITENIFKTTEKLKDLKLKLIKRKKGIIKKGKKPTQSSVIKAVERILDKEYMDDIFKFEIVEEKGHVLLSYRLDKVSLRHVKQKYLGKTILFTDRFDLTNDDIVNYYRSAWHVESSFRHMKNTKHLAVRPIFHWTDDKIRVHIFTCVLAYRLCCLLIKELADKGINTNINEMLEAMSTIKKVSTFVGDPNHHQNIDSFELGNDLAEKIEKMYALKDKYC